jgi:hypothetical protein
MTNCPRIYNQSSAVSLVTDKRIKASEICQSDMMKTKNEKRIFKVLLGWKIRTYKQIAILSKAGKTDNNKTSVLLKSRLNKFSSDIIGCKVNLV